MRRFRLRTLLVFVTLVCVALAAWRTDRLWWPYLIPVGEAGLELQVLTERPANPTMIERMMPSAADRITVRVITEDRWRASLIVRGRETFRTQFDTEAIGLAGNSMADLSIEVIQNELVICNRNEHTVFRREIDPNTVNRILTPVTRSTWSRPLSGRAGIMFGMYSDYEPTGGEAERQTLHFEIEAERE